MNKLMVVASLLIAFPVFASEPSTEQKLANILKQELKISKEENDKFVNNLAVDMSGIYLAVGQNKLDMNNPMRVIYLKLSNDLFRYNHDVLEMIKKEKDLENTIKDYKRQEVEYNDVIGAYCLKQIREKRGDIEKAQKCLVESRQINAEALFENLYRPKYVGRLVENLTQNTIDWMLQNAQFPVNEFMMRHYIGLLLYKQIFAYQID